MKASIQSERNLILQDRHSFAEFLSSQLNQLKSIIVAKQEKESMKNLGLDEATQTDNDANVTTTAQGNPSPLKISVDESSPKEELNGPSPVSPCSPTFGISLSTSPRSMVQSLKSIEKEMIATMESRLKQLKDAKENFVKYSGICK